MSHEASSENRVERKGQRGPSRAEKSFVVRWVCLRRREANPAAASLGGGKADGKVYREAGQWSVDTLSFIQRAAQQTVTPLQPITRKPLT